MAKLRFLILTFILVVAGYFLIFQLLSEFFKAKPPSVLSAQNFFGELAGKELPKTNDISLQKQKEEVLTADLKALIATSSAVTYPGSQAKVGVAITDLNSQKTFGLNQNDSFDLASVEKLLVAAYAFEEIDNQKFTASQPILGRPLIEHLKLLINLSNNDSWAALNSFLGFENLQNFATKLGLVNFSIAENKGSPADTNLLLGEIYSGSFFSKESKDNLLSFMTNTIHEERIPKGLPSNTVVYHKTGTLDLVVNDAAIVIHPKNPFILTVFTSDVSTQQASIDLIRQIAKKVWDFFDQSPVLGIEKSS